MKASNALVAAALAGVFAASTAVATAAFVPGDKDKEKDDCPGKDKEKKEEIVVSGDKEKDKDDCPDKDKEKKEEIVVSGDKEKDKDDCPDKDKEKKEEIL
jgi:hypothetical protein